MKMSLRVSALWLRVLSYGSAFVPLTGLLPMRFALLPQCPPYGQKSILVLPGYSHRAQCLTQSCLRSVVDDGIANRLRQYRKSAVRPIPNPLTCGRRGCWRRRQWRERLPSSYLTLRRLRHWRCSHTRRAIRVVLEWTGLHRDCPRECRRFGRSRLRQLSFKEHFNSAVASSPFRSPVVAHRVVCTLRTRGDHDFSISFQDPGAPVCSPLQLDSSIKSRLHHTRAPQAKGTVVCVRS